MSEEQPPGPTQQPASAVPVRAGATGAPEAGLARRLLESLGWLIPPLLALAIYLPTFGYGFVWDDQLLSRLGVYLTCDLPRILLGPANGLEYLPVRDLSLCLDYAVWGNRYGGFHATNVLLFIVAGSLAQLLYRRLFAGSERPATARDARRLALLAALVFVVHPLQVEPVAFITARNALLALVCLLGSLCAYQAFLESEATTSGARWYGLSIGLAGAAFFSKATALPLPALILLLRLQHRRDEGIGRALSAVAPFVALVLIATYAHYSIATRVGTVHGSMAFDSIAGRLPTVGMVPWFYLYKFIWPFDLTVAYSLRRYAADPVLVTVTTLGFALAVAAFLAWSWRRRSVGWLLVLAYLLALVPVSHLVPSSPALADRYAQIPLLFLAPLPVLALARLPRHAGIALTLAMASFFLVRSVSQVRVWENDITLFRHAAEVDPTSELAMTNLAALYWRASRFEEALDVARRYIKVDPDNAIYLHLQGRDALRRRDSRAAEHLLKAALEKQGWIYEIYMDLGHAYTQLGDRKRAIEAYEKAREAALTTPGMRANAAVAEKALRWLEH